MTSETSQNSEQIDNTSIQIGVGYDQPSNLFMLRLEVIDKGFLEARMDQSQFENLTARFVRLLQEINLAKAVAYQQKMKNAQECEKVQESAENPQKCDQNS